MQRINHGVAAIRLAIVTGREVDEYIAVGRIAVEIALERFTVDCYALQLALEVLLQVCEGLDEVIAAPGLSFGIVL
jgi:hypothetical protein